jgi:hypothetical protein
VSEESNVGIRVSCKLLAEIKNLLNFSPEMPANYAVDSALRELKVRLEQEKKQA